MKYEHTSYHTIVQLPAAELGGTKLPGILVDEPDQPLLVEAWKHLTCREYASMSPSWRAKAVWTIGRLYDWFRVQGGHNVQPHSNRDGQSSPSSSGPSSPAATSPKAKMSGNRLVDGFLRALEFGTIQQDGSDPTGLRWEPATPQMLNYARIHLRAFLQKLPDHVGDNGLSASRFASETTRGFDMNRSMLFHVAKGKRNRTGGRGTLTPTRTAKAFPSSLLPALIWEGCKRERPISDLRVHGEETLVSVYNLPLMMAIVLMAGGGLRYSELFHLFLDDVNGTEVRLYHPSEGIVHRKGRAAAYTRKQLLRDVYGMAPRHLASGQLHAGWKHLLITNTTDVFSRVHFLPGWGELFMAIFQAYKKQLYPAQPKHPYLFVSIDSGKYGEPWTIGSFRKSYQRALGRIGLTQNSALGTNPHGLRHRYGQTLVDLGMSPLHIQVCMHHISLESQLVYTQPSDTKVNQAMQQAAQRIHSGGIPPSTLTPQQALGYSYRSDPAGLFSSMRLGEGRDRV